MEIKLFLISYLLRFPSPVAVARERNSIEFFIIFFMLPKSLPINTCRACRLFTNGCNNFRKTTTAATAIAAIWMSRKQVEYQQIFVHKKLTMIIIIVIIMIYDCIRSYRISPCGSIYFLVSSKHCGTRQVYDTRVFISTERPSSVFILISRLKYGLNNSGPNKEKKVCTLKID